MKNDFIFFLAQLIFGQCYLLAKNFDGFDKNVSKSGTGQNVRLLAVAGLCYPNRN